MAPARVLVLEGRVVGFHNFTRLRENESVSIRSLANNKMNGMHIRHGAQNILQRKGGVQNEQYRHGLNIKYSRELCHTNNFFVPSIASHAYPAFISFFAVEFPISDPKVLLAD